MQVGTEKSVVSLDDFKTPFFWEFSIMTVLIQGTENRICQKTSIKRSIEALMQEIEPVVTEKDDFECRDKSISLALAPFFFRDYPDFDAKNVLNI